MFKFIIIYEKTETGFSAYSPDLLGCISVGETLEETEANMKEAIEFHLEGMMLEGVEINSSKAIKSEFLEFELN